MAPEYGATCGFFPIDDETLKYLKFSGRDQHTVDVVEHYANEQGLWASDEVEFTDTEKVQRVARKLRSGMVDVNGAGIAVDAPFGGFKHSGIGREAGEHGLEEFLEVKAVGGWS